MSSYNSTISSTQSYIKYLYRLGFAKSRYLKEAQIVEICDKIGVFKLKGYAKEIKGLSDKKIDDMLIVYFFDRYFAKELFDLTIRVEAKVKSILIEECYKLTNNHFFYLQENSHKWSNYKIDFATLKNWEVSPTDSNAREHYSHYILFYLQNYTFASNKGRYLGNSPLIPSLNESQYNYPPFKYLIESATLGSVLSFVESLKLHNTPINKQVANAFGIGSPKVFKPYLQRLNEIRNRVAHGGRIFNRTFRSATGAGKYHSFRANIDNHKAMDIYIFLHFMLNGLKPYNTIEIFEDKKIKRLFANFKNDTTSNEEGLNLIRNYNQKEFDSIKEIIVKRMSV